MESMGEYCSNAPCKWLPDLGKGGAHGTNAHNMFDGMPSQPEMSKEDQRISDPIPINSTMNKEEKWLDDALDWILEKFEQMEAKCMQEEKIKQIFQKLEEIEVRRSKAFEEMIAAIRATIAIIKGASSPTPMAPPPPAPTNSTWELGDRKDMDQAPYIVTKDLPKVTPTKCSTLCSSSDIKPDLIVDVVLMCATTAVASREFVLVDGTIDTINISTPCSTLGLDIKGDSNQVVLAFQTMMGISKVVPSSIQPVENFSSRIVTDVKLDTPMLNTCSLKCPSSDKRPLMEHTERNPWPPPWSAGVTRRWRCGMYPVSELSIRGISSMESMGEYCSNAPCKWLPDLGKGGAHGTNAHNMFDGMPSQPEMSKEDQRISDPIPINSTMNKEEKWLDDALDWILEKFEQMEAKCMQEEKIKQIFQKLEEIEVRRSKAFEEMIAAIRATIAIIKGASSPTPMAPPPPAPTNCLME
uniref:Uncharacterized protein n=1 Tax=Oryza meridionalis TaxID=40149 RepID=A0A0E0EDW9_9ORYZ